MTVEPKAGLARDTKELVSAFMAGSRYEPPVISPNEYRKCMRWLGWPLDEEDSIEAPTFRFPEGEPAPDAFDPEFIEEDDHGD